jgi:hypothetical protein
MTAQLFLRARRTLNVYQQSDDHDFETDAGVDTEIVNEWKVWLLICTELIDDVKNHTILNYRKLFVLMLSQYWIMQHVGLINKLLCFTKLMGIKIVIAKMIESLNSVRRVSIVEFFDI